MSVSAGHADPAPPAAGFTGAAIVRTNRNLRLTCLGVLATIALGGAVTWRYWFNFSFGPFAIDRIDLARGDGPAEIKETFVTVPARLSDSFAERARTRRGEKVEVLSEYFLVPMGDRIMVAALPPGSPRDVVTGELIEMNSDVRSSAAEYVRASAKSPEGRKRLNDRMLPFMLDGTPFRTRGFFYLAFMVPAAGLSLWGLSVAARRDADPARHPMMKELARHGDAGEMAAALDDEVAMMGGAPKGLSAFATAGWFVRRAGPYRVHVRKLSDLAWVYVKSTRHSVNGIPTGTTFGIVVWDRLGRALNIGDARGKGGEQAAHDLILKIRERAPWVMGGYGQDLERMWKTDRAGWLKAVDDIRAKGSG